MKTSFLRLTPALALIVTLGLGAAQAQSTPPAAATPANPAITKQADPAKAAPHKKHADKTAHRAADKKATDATTAQTAKPAVTAAPAAAPKS